MLADSLPVDVVAILEYVKTCQAKTVSPAEAQECFRDIHTKLCGLLSSMLASPLSGRMFVPMRTSVHDVAASKASVARQLA